MNKRAKQFMPFAALKGYYEVINDRQTIREDKKELSDDECKVLSEKLTHVKKGSMVKVTYYQYGSNEKSHEKKGRYVTVEGMVWDIDEVSRVLTVVRTKIMFDDILDINGNCIPFDQI